MMTEQEQLDHDLAYALALQEQFDLEMEEVNRKNQNTSQIKGDEEYARRLQAMMDGCGVSAAPDVPTSMLSDKLYSGDYEFTEEELQHIRDMDLVQESYFNFKTEEEEVFSRKNRNLDKFHKDKFSLVDQMKEDFKNVEFHPLSLEKLDAIERMSARSRVRRKDKSDFSTQQKVLDYRTRLYLFRMANNPHSPVSYIHGCVSAGKEANIFFAEGDNQERFAIKIFKTTMLEFKDRERYVRGEFRFRRGYSKTNKRKMVEKWALKEYSNSLRLFEAGIPCPRPIELRKHIYVMEFIGKSCWPAKTLQESRIRKDKLLPLYKQIVHIMRKMYHKAKLVHGDFSEYNILYHGNQPYVVDCSQAVSHDHPNAMEFLRRDCDNINQFFQKRGLTKMLTLRALFEYVVSTTIPIEKEAEYLDNAIAHSTRSFTDSPDEEIDYKQKYIDDVNDAVFRKAYIPRTLKEVENYVEHSTRMQNGTENVDQLYYREVVGMNATLSGPAEIYGTSQAEDDYESEEDDSEGEEVVENGISGQEVQNGELQGEDEELEGELDGEVDGELDGEVDEELEGEEEEGEQEEELSEEERILFEKFSSALEKNLSVSLQRR